MGYHIGVDYFNDFYSHFSETLGNTGSIPFFILATKVLSGKV